MSREHSTYESLIRPIEERLIQTAWRILRDPDDAKDAVQETLGHVWKRLRKVQNHPNAQALILKICANAAYDTLRRRIRRREKEGGDLDAVNPRARAQNPAEKILDSERATRIRAAIAQLPRNQAVATAMRLIQQEPYGAIGEALGCTPGTARVHVLRGRAKLRELLADLIRE